MLTQIRWLVLGIAAVTLAASHAGTVALCVDCSGYQACINSADSTKVTCINTAYANENQCLSSAYFDWYSCKLNCSTYCDYCDVEYTQNVAACHAASQQAYSNCEYEWQNAVQACASSYPGCN